MDGKTEQNIDSVDDDGIESTQKKKKKIIDENDDSSDDENEMVNETDASAAKLISRQKDENDYDEPDQEEMESGEIEDQSDNDEDEHKSNSNEEPIEQAKQDALSNDFIESYEFDKKDFQWYTVKFSVSI